MTEFLDVDGGRIAYDVDNRMTPLHKRPADSQGVTQHFRGSPVIAADHYSFHFLCLFSKQLGVELMHANGPVNLVTCR